MSNIDPLLAKVREHFARANLCEYFHGDEDQLAKAHVVMDTAEDAMLAMAHYESAGIGSEDGEKYLRLYGFLQATFLQQDALRELYRLFVGEFPEPSNTSAWTRLRELRNLTVGHPLDKGRRKEPRKRVFITRITIETKGFNYQVWSQETQKDSFERADLLTDYVRYQQEASEVVEKILEPLSRVPDEE